MASQVSPHPETGMEGTKQSLGHVRKPPFESGSLLALVLSTISFTVCFAAWVLNGTLVAYLTTTQVFSFTDSQVGWLLGAPVLTGALTRVPLGILTDRYGGRWVLFGVMLIGAAALCLLSQATSFPQFLGASFAFGVVGGSFAVGVGYVAAWFDKARQGTALGIFGMGNAGAGITSLVAPKLLTIFSTSTGPDGWRTLPRAYAAALCLMALLFVIFAGSRRSTTPHRGFFEHLAPLRDIVVWRLGFYYLLVFGGFVAVSQWLVPYSLNVYGLSVAGAGLVAALFSFPSGIIRAMGGWLSDRFGARPVMLWVFISCVFSCLILSIPRMDILSVGEGVQAKAAGQVTEVSQERITIGAKNYRMTPRHEKETRDDKAFLPQLFFYQEAVVKPGDKVEKKQLLARGVTRVFYPANFWLFLVGVFVFGVATGIGKASVYKFIPDHFPNSVGSVGGLIGMIGALGGFLLPLCFGGLLHFSGFWTSCFWTLGGISLLCLIWMEVVARRIVKSEAPELVRLIERGRETSLGQPIILDGVTAQSIEDVLRRIPFLSSLSREEMKSLAYLGTRQSMEPGQIIFSQGERGESLYVLLSGQVEVTQSSTEGTPRVLNTLEPGSFFGEIALIDGQPRSASVHAKSAGDLFLIGRSAFIALLQRSPRILADVLIGLSNKIRRGEAQQTEE